MVNTYEIYPKVGVELVCPICGKTFKATEETRYIRRGEYACSWKCFVSCTEEFPKVDATKESVKKDSQKEAPIENNTKTIEKFDLFSTVEPVAPKRRGRPKKQ